jgi:hypothetical protein
VGGAGGQTLRRVASGVIAALRNRRVVAGGTASLSTEAAGFGSVVKGGARGRAQIGRRVEALAIGPRDGARNAIQEDHGVFRRRFSRDGERVLAYMRQRVRCSRRGEVKPQMRDCHRFPFTAGTGATL